MPLVTLNTNVQKDDKRDNELCLEISQEASHSIDKPEGKIRVVTNFGQIMSFGGTTDPCAHLKIISIGHVDGERN